MLSLERDPVTGVLSAQGREFSPSSPPVCPKSEAHVLAHGGETIGAFCAYTGSCSSFLKVNDECLGGIFGWVLCGDEILSAHGFNRDNRIKAFETGLWFLKSPCAYRKLVLGSRDTSVTSLHVL